MTQARRVTGSLRFTDAKAAESAHAAMPSGTKLDGDSLVFDVTGPVDEAAVDAIVATAATGSVVIAGGGTERRLTALGRSFWQKRWDEGQTGWHEGKPNDLLVKHLDRLGLAPKSRVLVPLAGKSVDAAWIAAQGHEVVGIELSMTAIEAFFAERGIGASAKTKVGRHDAMEANGVTLVCADVFDLDVAALGAFDAIYDRAALVALEPSTRGAYVEVCRALAKVHAPTLLVSFAYDTPGPLGPPWSIDESAIRALFSKETVERIDSRPTSMSPRLAAAGVKSVEESAYLIQRA